MATSFLYHAFGTRGYEVLATRYEGGAVVFVLSPREASVRCPHCKRAHFIFKGGRWRDRVQTLPIGRRPVFLLLYYPRILCLECGRLGEIRPSFIDPYVTYTRQLARFVTDLCRLTTIRGVAEITGLSWDVVKSIEKQRLERTYGRVSLRGVRLVAVDEIAVLKGQRYKTIVLDLESGRVLSVADGRGEEALRPFLRRLRRARVKLEAIAMDMAAGYLAAVEAVLPKVPVVFDRFHVVKLMNERLDELRRSHFRRSEAPGRKLVKGVRYLVLMGRAKLEALEQKRPGVLARLDQALALNEPLSLGYYLKEKLRVLWDEPDRQAAEEFLDEWCEEAEATGIAELAKMATTLRRHRERLLNYFDHRITTGPLEGLNNKIKVLKRMAYGFRDMRFFELKILAIHASRYKLVG